VTGYGGAIAVEASLATGRVVTMRHVTFVGNRAGSGGAINLGTTAPDNRVALEASAVLFDGNSATGAGGAISAINGSVQIARGVFVNNQAATYGGAVTLRHLAPRTTILANALFARNKAPDGGSAFEGDSAVFINSTIADNDGLAVKANHEITAPWYNVHFSNTIVWKNSGGNCGGAGAQYIDDGHNLQYPGPSCGASIPVTDALLDTMYIPLPGSPAFGGGSETVCTTAPVDSIDVYGHHRPQPKVCTIGAAEGDIQVMLNFSREWRWPR
jgi:predicted outer membrane repeat protein